MKPIHLKLTERFAIIVGSLVVLTLVLFVTAVNQLKKSREFNKLTDDAVMFYESKYSMDSAQDFIFSRLPHDINFFKSGQNRQVEDFLNYNNSLSNKINALANSYFLQSNKKIKIKAFQINQLLRKYNDALENYTKYVYDKGFSNYGINGQVDIVIAGIIEQNKQEGGSDKLNDKVLQILELKNRYLLEHDFSIINKIKIANDEARAYVILSNKNQKLSLLTKLQKMEELIVSINQLDEAIGVTLNDGLCGVMKNVKGQYSISTFELRQLVLQEMSSAVMWGYILLGLVFLLLLAAIFILYKQLEKFTLRPLNKVKMFLEELMQGKLPETLKFKRKDEIAEMSQSLNTVVEGLKAKAAFALEIGKGKLNSHYEPLSEDDILGNALIDMEISLEKADFEDQKYKNDEKKRIWANEGIAKFSEILRQHSNDINLLADEIIQNLVKYLNAAQGGLYFYNDENKNNIVIELIATFAYDRKKYLNKTFNLGEGIIGAVALEKEKIFITDIPADYHTITSGLGDAQPRSILIIPLKLEDEMLGIIELASFDIFQSDEIEFVEKVGQSIASTITNVKINARTSKLLLQSQKQAEEMAEQEEEMRQNMEELRTTQEDFSRREAEMQGFLTAIQNLSLVLIFDNTGKIIDINSLFLTLMGTKREEIVGRMHREFSLLGRNAEEFDAFWASLKAGQTKTLTEKMKLPDGRDIYLKQTFSPILDNNGVLVKVLNISNDITEIKKNEKLIENKTTEITKLAKEHTLLNTAIDNSLLRCFYSVEGRILDVNEKYCQVMGHSKNEIMGKVGTILLKEDEKAQFEKIWNEVIKDKPYTGSLKHSKPTGEEIWIMASFIPIKKEGDVISNVYFLAQDITERRLKYQLLEEANKEIERLKKSDKAKD